MRIDISQNICYYLIKELAASTDKQAKNGRGEIMNKHKIVDYKIIDGDLLEQDTEAIVCPANFKPGVLKGMLDREIYKRAGKERMIEARKKLGKNKDGILEISECGITEGFKLKQKYVIHVVTPTFSINGSNKLLYNCYKNALAAASEAGIKSVAFPLLSSGRMGFPRFLARNIADDALNKPEYDNKFDRLLLVCRPEKEKCNNEYLNYNPDELRDRAYISQYEARDQFKIYQKMLLQMQNDQEIIQEYMNNSDPDHYDPEKSNEIFDRYVGENKRYTMYTLIETMKAREGITISENSLKNIYRMRNGKSSFSHNMAVELMLTLQLSRYDALRFASAAGIKFPDPNVDLDKAVLDCLDDHIYDWESVIERKNKNEAKETSKAKKSENER